MIPGGTCSVTQFPACVLGWLSPFHLSSFYSVSAEVVWECHCAACNPDGCYLERILKFAGEENERGELPLNEQCRGKSQPATTFLRMFLSLVTALLRENANPGALCRTKRLHSPFNLFYQLCCTSTCRWAGRVTVDHREISVIQKEGFQTHAQHSCQSVFSNSRGFIWEHSLNGCQR